MYMRVGVNSYDELIKQMDICIEHGYCQVERENLLRKAQNVFSEVWVRTKREGGISKYDDEKFQKLFNAN